MSEFIYPYRVLFPDTDAGGVMYHGSYVDIYDRARMEMFNDRGVDLAEYAKTGLYFIVREINVTYNRPVLLNERLECSTEIVKPGRVSLLFRQSLFAADDKEFEISYAHVKVGCVMHSQIAAIPSDILERLK